MTQSVKNIVVTKFYTLADNTKWYSDRSAEPQMATNYQQMIDILETSAKKFCVNMDEFRCHTGEVSDIREAFVVDFFKIKELWESEPCNILYLDADCMFLQPTDIFGKFSDFRMFNYTDPRSLKNDVYDFPHFFNCGIRYYPHDMSADVWDTGVKGFENMDRTHWDEEQRIYNQMLWQQPDVNIQTALQPHLAYQMLSGEILNQSDIDFNGITIHSSHIVHCHGSRHSGGRLETMRELAALSSGTVTSHMRFVYFTDSSHRETFTVDKLFTDTNKQHLEYQIKNFIAKTGVKDAYFINIQGDPDGTQSQKTSTKETSSKTETQR